MKNVVVFMGLLLALDAPVIDASSGPDARVAIRTYNYAAVPSDQLAAAKMEAEHIFKRAGIVIEWIECRVPGSTRGALCTEALLEGRDLMLRIMDRTPVDGERIVALGESMLDRERRGVLMTIDVAPVRAVADGTLATLPTLLGRAIAHEIGHLLLGSAEHGRTGLMRALWSHDELRGLKPGHWEFSSREAAVMRQTLRQSSRIAD